MKTLIIPDLHLHHAKAEKIIKYVGADHIVFLGDYFDNWNDDYRDNLIAAQWLASSLEQPNRTHLMGNHDINYAIKHRAYKCSGYDVDKDYAINSVLKTYDWQKLKLFTWLGNYLCSHAGVHNYFYYNFNDKKLEFKKWIQIICDEAMENAWDLNPPTAILQAGRSRGGSARHGGIMWCDITEFSPISQINQVFGHTPVASPKWINKENSKNLALDVNNSDYYAIHDDQTNDITTHWIGDM